MSCSCNSPAQRCFSLTVLVITGVLCSIPTTAQQSPPTSSTVSESESASGQLNEVAAATSNPDAASDSQIKLGPGDLVETMVYGVPELSTKARVSSAGDLYLPLIDYVHVSGLTLEEAQTVIEKRLSDGGFVKIPHVSVFVDEYASQAVTLLGEVARPGVYPIVGERRLFDLVSAAGGFTDKAGKNVTISHRNGAEAALVVHLARHLERSASTNVNILPGDTIVVSRAGIVYVVGDVSRPSGFLMESDSITVLQAVAMAGGTNRTAKLNAARIIRKTRDGMQQTPLPLKRILQAKASDLPMQADDILFVPSSTGKTMMYRSAEAVVQAATALTIVGTHP